MNVTEDGYKFTVIQKHLKKGFVHDALRIIYTDYRVGINVNMKKGTDHVASSRVYGSMNIIYELRSLRFEQGNMKVKCSVVEL